MTDRHVKRVEHRFTGTCCELPETRHRVRNRTRPGDRHKPDRKRHKQLFTLCLDGEGEDAPLEPGELAPRHSYTLLAASDTSGERTWTIEALSLSSRQCFDFLLSLPREARKVSFSFGYDTNMMLRDLPRNRLEKLWEDGFVYWNGYRISWTPHKVFSVSRGTKTCVVWDIFGYFQKTFAKTIFEWGVGTREEQSLIADMKAKRAGFSGEDKEDIKRYCLLECRLGAQTFDKLLAAVDDSGLRLTRYDGAGSVAAAMLRKHKVRSYMVQRNPLPTEIVLSAYYGGRFDHTVYGRAGNCIEYDINSAYPFQANSLPCLTHSVWRETDHYEPDSIGLYFCRWSIDRDRVWAPFPYRTGGRIDYLRNGCGWYWGAEAGAALALYPRHVAIERGYVLDRECDHRPLAFIWDYYQERKRLKEIGDLAQMVLKLGLNSIYGKTAQNKGKHVPVHQSFVWAGLITSNTRAMLLRAMQQDPEHTVLLATDALVCAKELELDTGDELGQWERKILRHLFVVQNGVYTATGVKTATRGFGSTDVNFDMIRRKAARTEGAFQFEVAERRFIGLGEALQSPKAWELWRRWVAGTSHVWFGRYRNKIVRGNRLYPADNPRGDVPSDQFVPELYREESEPLEWVYEGEDLPIFV